MRRRIGVLGVIVAGLIAVGLVATRGLRPSQPAPAKPDARAASPNARAVRDGPPKIVPHAQPKSSAAGPPAAPVVPEVTTGQRVATAPPQPQGDATGTESVPPSRQTPPPNAINAPLRNEVSRPDSPPEGSAGASPALAAEPSALDLSTFSDEVRQVNDELRSAAGYSRADLLAMVGRSSAAGGQFDRAAAAYALFLQELGTEHEYSARIAMELADCLAPLDLDNITIAHTEAGPRFDPAWRMQHAPRTDRLRQAVAAYELAAELTDTAAGAGRALLRVGWVQRALGDWEASTAAWERCAAEAAGTPAAADALWLAAENQGWTGQPAEAAETLQRFAEEYPDDARAKAATDRVEVLEAEARRTPEWLADPVASLQAEIVARAAVRPAPQVYRSAMEWLRRGRQTAAQVAIGRWACTQTAWPTEARLAAHFDLVDALLNAGGGGDAERLEAAEVLGRIMDFAPSDDWFMSAGLRRAQLLRELRQYEAGDRTLDQLERRAKGSVSEPLIWGERIQALLDRGDRARASAVYRRLLESYPEHSLTERFKPVFSSGGAKEQRN
jgi:tetratricopeptide (TPR) repeat protein